MRITPLDLVDIFVYVVVLNLVAQFFPGVSESFATSLLTADHAQGRARGVLLVKKRCSRAAPVHPGRSGERPRSRCSC
jgi:hypothetical protein